MLPPGPADTGWMVSDHDFLPVDLESALDLEERLAGVPSDTLLKGMFFKAVIQSAERASGRRLDRKRYVPFIDYPVSEFLPLVAECSALVNPDVSPGEALRRIGMAQYLTFADSHLGRVILSLRSRLEDVLRYNSKGYKLIGKGLSAELADLEDGRAIVALRGVWDFPAHQVGIYEGLLEAFGKPGEVRVRTHSICELDLLLRWSPDSA